MRGRTVQPEIRPFDSVLRSLVTPFDKSKTKNENCVEERNVFGNGKCGLSAIQEGRNSGEITKVDIFGKERCKMHCQFQRFGKEKCKIHR